VVPNVGARNQPLSFVPPEDDAPAIKVSGSPCPAGEVGAGTEDATAEDEAEEVEEAAV
jgi:hypothetical protein